MAKIFSMRIAFLSLLLTILLSCGEENKTLSTDLINNPASGAEGVAVEAMPRIVFEEESFDFGNISQGEKVEHIFSFINDGNADLIISSAVGSCGCTVPSYPKEPIRPGEEGDIRVIFDSNGKEGAQHKRVTISANTNPSNTVIAIMANVLVPETKKDSLK